MSKKKNKVIDPFQLYNQDAITFLKNLPNDSIDLIITDPPYESLEKHRATGTTTRLKCSKASSNQWFHIFENVRFFELFTELYRVLKNNRHFYLLCDSETMFVAKPIAEQCGFKFWKPIVWDKISIGMGYHYRSRYEFILFFEKGKRKVSNFSIPDILSVRRVFNGYPTEKPTELFEILIKQSSEKSEVVLDPFMGSGSIGAAAIKLQRLFLGNDLLSEAVDITNKRLKALNLEIADE